jgi:hypothetical protein
LQLECRLAPTEPQRDVVAGQIQEGRPLKRRYVALRPGGFVVVEGFHRDVAKTAAIGGEVVFDTNELLHLFNQLRIVRYEDTEGIGNLGLWNTRLVRLCTQKL